MKKCVIAAAFVVLLSAAAHAQVVVDTSKEKVYLYGYRARSSGYYGWGGYGSYGGWGSTYSGFGYDMYPGFGYAYTDGPMVYSFGSNYGYSGYRGVGYRGGYFGRPNASADAAGPMPRTGPVADRIHEYASAREIEEGRRRLKLGDYKGAVDQFRSAVASHTESPVAQAWFAVALAIAGDGKNADKALRAAASAGFPLGRITLADGFHDEKERSRVAAALSKAGPDGALAAAFVLSLTGDGAKLKQLAEKDPAARRLLPKP